MKKAFPVFAALCLAAPCLAQDEVRDGLRIWTTNWDNQSVATGYDIIQWTYGAGDGFWTPEFQYVADLVEDTLAEDELDLNIYDMGMDLIDLGDGQLRAIITASKGTGHFPSMGTQFQHRVLTEAGEWALAQPALFETPADVSPLGVDIYLEDGGIHIAWVEDNDSGGPVPNTCEIYTQPYELNADGKLSPAGDKSLVYSRALDWGGGYPGNGGITGLTAADYDGDGDVDLFVGEMFYGSDPTAVAIQWIERTGPSGWADDLQEIWVGTPDTGAEGVCFGDVDGDAELDFVITSGNTGPWNTVHWLEKKDDPFFLFDHGMILDAAAEGEPFGISTGHIFGLYLEQPEVTNVGGWELY